MNPERTAPNPAHIADSLGGHGSTGTHRGSAVEGATSPQAMIASKPKQDTPAGQISPTRTT